jgi:hypothetical protein
VPHLYDLPLRACVSADIDNLMFAGRNISATHLAFASTRVMATCAAIGQGVGTASAFAALRRIDPAKLSNNADAMRTIQRRLLLDDAYLIGQRNDDPLDLAREARITASSEQPSGPATNVISGQTRSVHGDNGAPRDRAGPGTHRWMSDPHEPFAPWLLLQWPGPLPIGMVQLIFDTGLHRVLTLTHSDAYAAKMCWGSAQPETVRDYHLELLCMGAMCGSLRVTGNAQRRRMHWFESPVQADALRIVVDATNGLDHARICEVRVYSNANRSFARHRDGIGETEAWPV